MLPCYQWTDQTRLGSGLGPSLSFLPFPASAILPHHPDISDPVGSWLPAPYPLCQQDVTSYDPTVAPADIHRMG